MSNEDIIEEKLRASEQRYRALIDHASDAIILIDYDGNLLDVNISLCNMFGYTKKELLTMHVEELVEPQNLKADPIPYDTWRAGKSTLIERRVIHKDGTMFYLEVHARQMPDGSILAIARNITERKKIDEQLHGSEQRYRSLIDQASDAIMITDMQGNFSDINIMFCKMFGYTREEVLCMNISSFIDAKELTKEPTRFDLLQKGISILRERKMVHKDGTIIEVEANVKKLPDGRVLAIARDIRERKKIEGEIQHSQQQLRELAAHLQTIREEERTNIAREIHDELGQHLTALRMGTFWLRKKIPDHEKAAIEKVSKMIAVIDETINSVKRISTELRPNILDDLGLPDALEWQGNDFEEHNGIRCTFRCHCRDVSFERSLSTGVFRVFQESLTNVVRHAGATEIKTSLELADGKIVLKIKDNGKGFDEIAVREKKTLGIIGMKERAIMFGGNLTIESARENGTTVILQIPVQVISGKIFSSNDTHPYSGRP